MKLYIGLGRFSPWILDPSHNNSVGQNTSMISGVPLPARNRNGVERMMRQDANKDTLFLNHRFKSRISRKPSRSPTKMLGNLTVYGVKPKIRMENFCNIRYGKSTKSPFRMPSLPK